MLKKIEKNISKNPLFKELEKPESFFSDITPQNKNELSIRKPTIREKILEKSLKEDKATPEEIENFRKHFNKTDKEILNTSYNQQTKSMMKWFLNEEDTEILNQFLIMTYRNNFGYWIALNNIF